MTDTNLQKAINYIYPLLNSFATRASFWDDFQMAFGQEFNVEIAEFIQQSLIDQTFVLPNISIVEDVVLGNALGAFSAETSTIYLRASLVSSGDVQQIGETIIEETGHWIDQQVNLHDAAGDEGAIFRLLVDSISISSNELAGLKAKDDSTTILINGQIIQVEQQNFIGASGSDNILGSLANDFIDGRGGNDYLSGGLGEDTIIGGAGSDTLAGSAGSDILIGPDQFNPNQDPFSVDTIITGNGSLINRSYDTVQLGDDYSSYYINSSVSDNTLFGYALVKEFIIGSDQFFGGTDKIILSGTVNDYLLEQSITTSPVNGSINSNTSKLYRKEQNNVKDLIAVIEATNPLQLSWDLNSANFIYRSKKILPKNNFGDLDFLPGSNYLPGNKESDVLWRNVNGDVNLWKITNNSSLSQTPVASVTNDWVIVGTGDFNGDRKSDIVWRNINSGEIRQWQMNGSSVISDSSLGIIASNIAILAVADFDGDGKADGLLRDNNGNNSIIRLNGSAILSNYTTDFIDSTWSVKGTGDFNGDGKADILWRNVNGTAVIWFMNGSSVLTSGTLAPLTNDWFVAGVDDFNADGKADILWRNTNGTILAWQMNGTSIQNTATVSAFANNLVINNIGDYNGDGTADVLFRNINSGEVSIWQTNITTSNTISLGTVSKSWQIVAPDTYIPLSQASKNDFGGDRKADILWRSTSGEVYTYQMNGSAVASEASLGIVSNDWKIAGLGDFNADRKSDILWRNDNGLVYAWQIDGNNKVAEGAIRLVSNDWKISGTGDFNGDGKSDILWRNINSGETYIYQMSGLTTVGTEGSVATVSNDWKISGTGDFNGDGKSDILWRNSNTGSTRVYLMDGIAVTANNEVRQVDNSWAIEGVDDFNGDGKSDILWRNNNTGSTYIYLMNGTTVSNEGEVGIVPTNQGWNIAGTGDYNGDAKADILWRNNNGLTYLWTVDGLSKLAEGAIRTVDNSWQIAAPTI
jgi:FG-GAP-like repeat/RTX calcium-binding nonapeptide repeat (4 copies)